MVLKIAHRGASGYATENSLEAFKKALQLNADVDVIEFDVRCTKDGELIVVHDSSIDRVSNGKGMVNNLTLTQIKKFRLSNGESIPTFHEVFTLLIHRCICQIDIKDLNSVKTVMHIIKSHGLEDSVIITSCTLSVLQKVRKISPNVKIEVGRYKGEIPTEQEIKKIKNLKANIMSPHFSIVTKDMVEKAHNNGLDVHVWGTNDKKTIKKMKKIGVDGITTGFPDKI